jgi:ATP-binding cassette subfamily F protein uup
MHLINPLITPVRNLSGGELNRLLLARLFSMPANLLVLDEPTNDLDIESLELLEDLLSAFSGTIILVSHDRFFLDNVVTTCLAFTEDGSIQEYIGGYTNWQQHVADQKNNMQQNNNSALSQNPKKSKKEDRKNRAVKKLTYQEQKELQSLPEKIDKLDNQIASLQQEMASSDFYEQDADKIASSTIQLRTYEAELESAYIRWELLESALHNG